MAASPLKISSLSYCNNRLQTFRGWSYRDAPSPTELAKAGFCWAGADRNSDLTFCPFCDLKLHKWSISDDPFFQHYRFRPTCEYVLLCYTVKERCPCEIKDPYTLARQTYMMNTLPVRTRGLYESDNMLPCRDVADGSDDESEVNSLLKNCSMNEESTTK